MLLLYVFFFNQKTAYEMRISDWSSDVCSSDLQRAKRDCRHISCTTKLRFAHDAERAMPSGAVATGATRAARPAPGIPPCLHGSQEAKSPLPVRFRSEDRRVGKECVRTGRSRWSLVHEKKKKRTDRII